MKILHSLLNHLIKLVRKFLLKLMLISETNPLANPLFGDTAILYAFVIRHLIRLEKGKKVLDVGCCGSPLTTIIKEIGFNVEGIDIRPSPLYYDNIKYRCEDFLTAKFDNNYDIIVMCYVLEHIGLKGRYGSTEVEGGDLLAVRKAKALLKPNGLLIIGIPYGVEKVIKPLHRVYGKNSALLKYLYKNFELIAEEFYKKNENNVWIKCDEQEAAKVNPSEDKYALGLFVFKKMENEMRSTKQDIS